MTSMILALDLGKFNSVLCWGAPILSGSGTGVPPVCASINRRDAGSTVQCQNPLAHPLELIRVELLRQPMS